MEIWPISRHLEAFKRKYTPNSQCVFIAPSIFKDSERQIRFIKDTEKKEQFNVNFDEVVNKVKEILGE